MSDIAEKLSTSTADIVGANKILGTAIVGQETDAAGVAFESHLQAATASHKRTETQKAERGMIPSDAAASRSLSDHSLTSKTETETETETATATATETESAVPGARTGSAASSVTGGPVVIEPNPPAEAAGHKNDNTLATSQLESGDPPRTPVILNIDDKLVDSAESVVYPEKTISGNERVAVLDASLIGSADNNSTVPAEQNDTGAEVVAGSSERLVFDGESALEEVVASQAVAAQNLAANVANSGLDSPTPSVALTTDESGDVMPAQTSSNAATSVSTNAATSEGPTLLASLATTGSTGHLPTADSRPVVVNAHTSVNTSATSDTSLTLAAAGGAGTMANLQTGMPQNVTVGIRPDGKITTDTEITAGSLQQSLQTAEVASSVKSLQSTKTIDTLSDVPVRITAQSPALAIEPALDASKNNVVTQLAMQTNGALSTQSTTEVDESIAQMAVNPMQSITSARTELKAPINRDLRTQAPAEAVMPANLTAPNMIDSIATTTSMQISSIDGDSAAANQPSNMFLAASNGIVAAPNPTRMTAGPSLVLAPTVMQMTPDFQDQALVGNVRWMVNEGISNATINVSPGGMGPISVQLTMEGEKMNVSFFAGQAATREALDMAAPRLRDHLQSQGLDQVRVDVSDSRSDNSRNMQHSQTGEKHSSYTRHTSKSESLTDENTNTANTDSGISQLRPKSSLIDAFA